ncbi:BON domain-containing protein [Pusillimonas sp. SM2304]|uniref:BON domain-containing protein n=1 Tax=Pusillimonas sp. SM2304 TaxID=3073241 RepID=UPI002876A3AC|nr:BON domain-containing protein [Pusillimonas sp. SM2304]MDS1139279.1 BON domain-containing protein [Pusillimonas sp. SM2304]
MSTQRNTQRLLLAGVALAGLTALSGCGALVVGGAAATTAAVATDRRTAGEQVEDQAIEMKAAAEMRKLFEDKGRVNTTSYAGLLLLTGDVPTEQDKQKAGEAAQGVEKVQKVVNQIRVGDLTPVSVRTNDTWLSSKVRTALINTKEVPSRTISVTTERGIVYMLGKVTDAEGQRAAKAAAGVSGVNKVVKLFQIVSPESIAVPASPAPIDDAASPGAASTTESSNGVEALPVQ